PQLECSPEHGTRCCAPRSPDSSGYYGKKISKRAGTRSMQCFSQTTYARGSSLRKVLTLLVTVVSIAWVVMLLADDWPEIKVALRKIDPVFLCAGALLTTLANYLVFEGFRLVASGTDLRSLSRAALAHFYFAAQLFKHLPGRI